MCYNANAINWTQINCVCDGCNIACMYRNAFERELIFTLYWVQCCTNKKWQSVYEIMKKVNSQQVF